MLSLYHVCVGRGKYFDLQIQCFDNSRAAVLYDSSINLDTNSITIERACFNNSHSNVREMILHAPHKHLDNVKYYIILDFQCHSGDYC